MPDTPVVFLTQKGEIRQGKLKNAEAETLATALKKKTPPSLLGRYVWKQKTLFLFGYDDGKAGTENQHHLPPPLEGLSLFGDILILCSPSPTSYTQFQPFKTADYESFYTQKLEGDDEEEDEFLQEEEEEAPLPEVVIPEEEDDMNEEDGENDDSESDSPVEEEGQEVFEDEEVVLPLKPVRVRARKNQGVLVQESEGVETTLDEVVESQPIRKRMLTLLENRFPFLLNVCSPPELEKVLFESSFEQATKLKIYKSWDSPVFQEIYKATCRRILGNLTPDSYVKNTMLFERFKAGELTLAQIVKQNYYELCPEQWEQMVDRQAKREKIQLEGDFSRATDRWQCNKCKKRKCTYYELQTRSADEPMTIFIHCLNCGNRWTQ